MIAIPVAGPAIFKLLEHPYEETIVFTEITPDVPNRGGVNQQDIFGLTYDLVVTKFGTDPKNKENVLHIENGMILLQTDIKAQPDPINNNPPGPITATTPFPIARQASIPHGNVALCLGDFFSSTGTPPFTSPELLLSLAPVGNPTDLFGYAEGFPKNLNQTLLDHITANNQTIGNVTVITMDTNNPGGNISNIPFVESTVKPTRFNATFWIEEVLKADGSVDHIQLQYSQITDLEFAKDKATGNLVVWPHGDSNTLVKTHDGEGNPVFTFPNTDTSATTAAAGSGDAIQELSNFMTRNTV